MADRESVPSVVLSGKAFPLIGHLGGDSIFL